MELEVVFLEDPACSWCWAFQPVETTFLFEWGEQLRWRMVMAGLRDHPVPDASLIVRHWETGSEVSGMPFEPAIWKSHILQSTFVACRAVKAVAVRNEEAARRLLRRIREAFYVEQKKIDELDVIFELAEELGLSSEDIIEQLSNGRADALFDTDREDGSRYGFGFPTIVIRRPTMEEPKVLQGSVPYRELLDGLYAMGVNHKSRKRFRGTDSDWRRLLELQPRITMAELQMVTNMKPGAIENRLKALGTVREGPFYCLPLEVRQEQVLIPEELSF